MFGTFLLWQRRKKAREWGCWVGGGWQLPGELLVVKVKDSVRPSHYQHSSQQLLSYSATLQCQNIWTPTKHYLVIVPKSPTNFNGVIWRRPWGVQYWQNKQKPSSNFHILPNSSRRWRVENTTIGTWPSLWRINLNSHWRTPTLPFFPSFSQSSSS